MDLRPSNKYLTLNAISIGSPLISAEINSEALPTSWASALILNWEEEGSEIILFLF